MSDSVYEPSLETVLDERENQTLAKINCIQIGKVNSYDTQTQSATVEIQVKRRIGNDAIISYPLLVDCPVFVLQGGRAFIEFPIEPGDYCLVLFNDRDIDTWWKTANVAEPKTRRKHSLSDGFVLVGINPSSSPLDLQADTLGINAGDKKIRVNNAVETLATIMSDFIDAINAIVTTGSPETHTVNAASQAALNTIKTRIGTLLEA